MEIKINMNCTFDPGRKKNSLRFTMAGGEFRDEDGNKVGEINNVLPVGLQVLSEKTGKIYSFTPTDFFNAVIEAEALQEVNP